jgi:hypothetical protein
MKVFAWLETSHAEFLASIAALSDDQWTWTPAPDRWSAGQTAEHIVLGEALLFRTVKRALASPTNADWEEQTKGKTEFIERVMAPRKGKAIAPESLVPKGMTAAQVIETFERQRVAIVQFAKEADLSRFEQYTVDHPMPVFGTLNAYQWLIYIPLHTMRHTRQILEVKSLWDARSTR